PEEANKTLAAGEEGFKEMVNGKDLSNWQGAVENYDMKDGAIYCKAGKGGDLLTLEEYGDCVIRTEFILPLGGNNGIALRTPKEGNAAWNGLELQVIDSDGYNAKAKTPLKDYQYHGSVYGLIGAKHGYLRPVGQWNFQEVTVKGQHITVTLNGTKILDADLSQVDRSKLAPKKTPKGLDKTSGFIGFAGHSDPVGFRSFRVKKL
ncbi:MAG TPA: DUF1080 domain-containing protein, partial [Verrucomicrobiales bacterium]|nr:DUF1080 domain-containing protein [Verrucomicrobiales bacterium]